MQKCFYRFCLLLAVGLHGSVIQAAEGALIAPVAATAQSYYTSDDRSPRHTIDGSGMNPSSPVTSASTAGVGTRSVVWLSNGTVATWITFDLGVVKTITGLHLWNYNEYSGKSYSGRGIKTADIYSGSSMLANGASYASAGPAWGQLVTSMTFTQAPANDSYTGESYMFDTPLTTRYVQLYVTSNHGLDNYAGISEIRFYTDTIATTDLVGYSGTGSLVVSDYDLLQNAVSFVDDSNLVLSVKNAGGQNAASLTDGSFGNTGVAGALCIESGHITYYLDTDAKPEGYSVGAVEGFSGWADGGRVNQKWYVSFRRVGETEFSDVYYAEYIFNKGSQTVNACTSLRLDRLELFGVDAIRFDFDVPTKQHNSGSGYRELDVYPYLGEAIQPVDATAQSWYRDKTDGREPVHAIDSTGMSQTERLTSWATSDNGFANKAWLSNGTKETWIAFDLGSEQLVTGLYVWNYNEFAKNTAAYTGRGIRSAELYVGTNMPANSSPYSAAGGNWGTFVQELAFSKADGSNKYRGEPIVLEQPVYGRYFQLYVTDNHGFDDYTGLSEILFYRSAPVREVTRLSSGSKLIFNDETNRVSIVEGQGSVGAITLDTENTIVESIILATPRGPSELQLGSGSLTLNTIYLPPDAGDLEINGGTLAGSGLTGPALLLNQCGAGVLSIDSAIVDGNKPTLLLAQGSGEVVLSGDNSYTGGTSVRGGRLTLADGQLGTGQIDVDQGGVLSLLGGCSSSDTMVHLNGGNMVIDGDHCADYPGVKMESGSTLTINSGGELAFGHLEAATKQCKVVVDGGVLSVSEKDVATAATGWIGNGFDRIAIGEGGMEINSDNGSATLDVSLLSEGAGGKLTKTGANTLTLTTALGYCDKVQIKEGIVKLALRQPLIHYNFDSIEDGQVVNLGSGGSAYNGVINGTGVEVVNGVAGNALEFSQSGDGVVSASNVPMGNGFTFAAWVKSGGERQGISQRIICNVATVGFMGVSGENYFWGFINNLSGQTYEYKTNVMDSDTNQFHHVAFIWDGQRQRFYYDGAIIKEDMITGHNTTTSSKIGVGNNPVPNNEWYKGAIDDVYIFDRPLDADEVVQLATGEYKPVNLLASDCELELESGSVLELADGIRQTVRTLSLDGESAKSGVWGAPGSGARYTSAHFSGSGLLHVQEPLPPDGTLLIVY